MHFLPFDRSVPKFLREKSLVTNCKTIAYRKGHEFHHYHGALYFAKLVTNFNTKMGDFGFC